MGTSFMNLKQIIVALPLTASQDVIGGLQCIGEECCTSISAMRVPIGTPKLWHVTWHAPVDMHKEIWAEINYFLDQHKIEGEPVIQDVPDINWLQHAYQQLPALSIGPFYVYGAHIETPPPANAIPIQMDAVTAFGSGYHGTTKGCLLALATLKGENKSFHKIWDVGTGTGILAIAAHHLFNVPVWASDNDPEAVRVVEEHIQKNNLSTKEIIPLVAEGTQHDVWEQNKKFDLVIANILAGPLVQLAPDFADGVEKGGFLILSGLLKEQFDDIENAYTQAGFKLYRQFPEYDWLALIYKRV
ncbi:MAG: methyltransferase [Alphaproteobacteria bacterium]|nr:methyltransferase [Alphaproteobacteria bacterium]